MEEMLKKLVLFAAAVLTLVTAPVVAPQKAQAATLVCLYWPANTQDHFEAGYYWTLEPYGELAGGKCTPK